MEIMNEKRTVGGWFKENKGKIIKWGLIGLGLFGAGVATAILVTNKKEDDQLLLEESNDVIVNELPAGEESSENECDTQC